VFLVHTEIPLDPDRRADALALVDDLAVGDVETVQAALDEPPTAVEFDAAEAAPES